MINRLTNAALIKCVMPRPSSNRTTEPSMQPNISFSLSGLNEWQQTCDCRGIDVIEARWIFDLFNSYTQISIVTSPCTRNVQYYCINEFKWKVKIPKLPFAISSVQPIAIDCDSFWRIPHWSDRSRSNNSRANPICCATICKYVHWLDPGRVPSVATDTPHSVTTSSTPPISRSCYCRPIGVRFSASAAHWWWCWIFSGPCDWFSPAHFVSGSVFANTQTSIGSHCRRWWCAFAWLWHRWRHRRPAFPQKIDRMPCEWCRRWRYWCKHAPTAHSTAAFAAPHYRSTHNTRSDCVSIAPPIFVWNFEFSLASCRPAHTVAFAVPHSFACHRRMDAERTQHVYRGICLGSEIWWEKCIRMRRVHILRTKTTTKEDRKCPRATRTQWQQ